MKTNTYRVPSYKCLLVKDRQGIRIPIGYGDGEGLVSDTTTAAKILQVLTDKLPIEQMILLYINNSSRITGYSMVAQGGLNSCSITAVEILRSVLLSGCGAFILGHNHPSGDATPSIDDRKMTVSLAQSAKCVGLSFIDHIVVSREGKFTSIITW